MPTDSAAKIQDQGFGPPSSCSACTGPTTAKTLSKIMLRIAYPATTATTQLLLENSLQP